MKKKKIKTLSPKKQEALEKGMDSIAQVCLKAAGKYKMIVIIQDSMGRGISRSTEGFTPIEFMQWVNAIVRFNNTNL